MLPSQNHLEYIRSYDTNVDNDYECSGLNKKGDIHTHDFCRKHFRLHPIITNIVFEQTFMLW
jgi:hypothetical protein